MEWLTYLTILRTMYSVFARPLGQGSLGGVLLLVRLPRTCIAESCSPYQGRPGFLHTMAVRRRGWDGRTILGSTSLGHDGYRIRVLRRIVILPASNSLASSWSLLVARQRHHAQSLRLQKKLPTAQRVETALSHSPAVLLTPPPLAKRGERPSKQKTKTKTLAPVASLGCH